MNNYGLIGFPLDHSFSKKYFEDKFRREKIHNCTYHLWPLKSIDAFPHLLKSIPGLKGLNVTIPYKELVMGFLDEIEAVAAEVKAVNCVKVVDRRLKGYNTDITGLEASLNSFISAIPQQAFILGTGGASRAAIYVLRKLNIPFVIVSGRISNGFIRYADIKSHLKAGNLFINTTPLGTYPDINSMPDIPYEALSANDYLFDMVYNPAETPFLKRGKEQGAKTRNGLEMLEIQAEESWKIWNSE